MVAYMKEPGEKKFAMQYLLHKVFGNSYFCLSQVRACDDGCTGYRSYRRPLSV